MLGFEERGKPEYPGKKPLGTRERFRGSKSTKWFSSTWFLVELEIENVGFWREGKTGVPGKKKTSRNEGENQQQQTEPTGVDSAWFGDVMLLGRLSNDDGDGNENGKKGLD